MSDRGPSDVPAVGSLPPRVALPPLVQGVGAVVDRRRTLQAMARRHGSVFTVEFPLFGRCVVVADPHLAKQLFTSSADSVRNVKPNLGRILGSGSMFALEGTDHRRRRKLLTPPLHGKRMARYEQIIVEEVERETASWPVGKRFATVEPMMRITLNAILRAVFGAEGEEFEELRRIIPPLVTTGSRMATLPDLPWVARALDPAHQFARRRETYQQTVGSLISAARSDPRLADREDILALMLQSTYDDGSTMSDTEISDELLTLLVAGHETTANTLAWAFERLQRHPQVLADLVAEVDDGGTDLRHAVILETQRSRPVIDLAGRHVVADHLDLGPWRIPKGYNILVGISLLHDDSLEFADPEKFDPARFLGVRPGQAWIPFGGGTRRCIGAAFATMEMDVVLRTVLRDFTVEPTTVRAEGWYSRGVAYAPRRGGRVTLWPRAARVS
ncbi:cytochrome P450 [Gordonia soli]|uniref:cytochrome P450 n=1 Tax=Gordonia soli TaxID=320799 RepID=UPI003F713E6E